MRISTHIGWCWVILLLASGSSLAQTDNPFELLPRLPDDTAAVASALAGENTGNPFDVVPGERATPRPPEPLPEIKPLVSDGRERFHFVLTLVQLLLLASLVTLLRTVILRAVQAFANENMFNQLYREREARGPLPFMLLTILFFLNAGLFLFHLNEILGSGMAIGYFQQLGLGILLVVLLLFLKYLLLQLIGYIFPVQKQVDRYRFLITVFAIVTGLILIPVNLLLAYGPSDLHRSLVLGTLGVIALIYLFRALRALLIANQKVSLFSFHFFLYICTIEIAPVLIFWKLISNQL